ncbi:MAG: LemA family protein [Candidatus Hadarchaeales archaeon]
MFDIVMWVMIFLIVLAFVVYIIVIFNGLIQLRNNIDRALANIDVLIKQRNDEMPNLVAVVKGYAKHEKRMIQLIVRAREAYTGAKTPGEKAAVNDVLTGALKSLFALAESYPKLRANENFIYLQERITGIENEIADRREFYNDSVLLYNTRIRVFPDTIIARLMRCKPMEFFRATEEEKRKIELQL